MTRIRSYILLLFLIIAVVFVLFVVNISLGSVSIPPVQVIKTLAGIAVDNISWQNIILQFRVPKAITAVLVGSGLGISGLLMQTLFRNPLAGPFVLGISAGASLGVALSILAGMWFGLALTQSGIAGTWALAAAAVAGAFFVLVIVLIISSRIRDSMSLLIIGLMMGSATSAVVSILQYYSRAESVQAYLIWTFGSLGGVTWEELEVFVPVILTGIILSWLITKKLNALLLGDQYAESLGMNIKKARFLVILITSVLAGAVTAFCGPIAFIGIAVPHLARSLFRSTDHRLLLPLVAMTGAVIMLGCDIVAQVPGTEFTLPINAVTSVIGAPLVIWIVFKRQDLSSSFS
ncbi:MAG TPA: iron ABC transporter permease [Cyclobacteriaceae bacterium]|nr:iron ABC transporter permease [Cyclobacteriaceae bacterium]